MSALRFAYSTINWGEFCDLAGCLAEIRVTGWTAVELFAHSLEWMGMPKQLHEVLGSLHPATLFGSVELPASERQRVIHKHRIDYCAAIGADAYGLVGAGRPRHRPPTSSEIHDLADLCEDLATYGVDHGVTVAYHPHTRCTVQYAHEIDELLSATRHLTLCLDVSHVALVGEDPLAHITKYRDRLGYIHLKDWGRGDFVELGRGALGLDFGACLALLQRQSFTGWIVIEQSTSDVSAVHSAQLNAAYIKGMGYTL